MKFPTTVACPRCGQDVVWNDASPYRPFCSERCKMIDLGQWATGSYSIPDGGSTPGEDAAPEPDHQA